MARKTEAASLPPPPPRFDEWFRCVFQRPERIWWGKKHIDFDGDYLEIEQQYEFSGINAEIVELAAYTLANCEQLVADIDDGPLADGIFVLFNPANSEIPNALRSARNMPDGAGPLIHGIENLYRHVFAKRCANLIRREVDGRLNDLCFMLWDVSPLDSWITITQKSGKRPLLEMLDRVLRIPHDACIESVLHGLGHMAHKAPDDIPGVIDRFLQDTPGLRAELRAYAIQARTGYIL